MFVYAIAGNSWVGCLFLLSCVYDSAPDGLDANSMTATHTVRLEAYLLDAGSALLIYTSANMQVGSREITLLSWLRRTLRSSLDLPLCKPTSTI